MDTPKITTNLNVNFPTVNGQLRLLVDLVEPDGLVELDLARDCAGVALLVHPLHGERVILVKAAYLAHLVDQLVVADPVVDVCDEHASAMVRVVMTCLLAQSSLSQVLEMGNFIDLSTV